MRANGAEPEARVQSVPGVDDYAGSVMASTSSEFTLAEPPPMIGTALGHAVGEGRSTPRVESAGGSTDAMDAH